MCVATIAGASGWCGSTNPAISPSRRAASQKVTFGEINSPDATIEALDAVTEDDVRRIAAGINGEPVVACVGPHAEDDFV